MSSKPVGGSSIANTGISSVGTGSSAGSSARGGVNKNLSMYQDDSKVYAAVKLYTTLEDTSLGGDDAKLDIKMLGKAQVNENIKGASNKNIILRLEKLVMKRLFIVNHIILSNQAVTVPIFHVIFFLTFIQILFNIFYKVEITNEFNSDPIFANSTMNSTLSLNFTTNATLPRAAATSILGYLPRKFLIHEYFYFINF